MNAHRSAKRACRLVAVLVAIFSVVPRVSQAQTWVGQLLGTNENPANNSTAVGSIMVTLVSNTLSITESFSGLTAAASGAHIHCCGVQGANVAIALPFPAFPAATTGTYVNSFDLLSTTTYGGTFLSASGGSAAGAEAALIAGLNSGVAYANIHDANFPGGEIRANLILTPEPSSVALLALGMAGMGAVVARRRRSKV